VGGEIALIVSTGCITKAENEQAMPPAKADLRTLRASGSVGWETGTALAPSCHLFL